MSLHSVTFMDSSEPDYYFSYYDGPNKVKIDLKSAMLWVVAYAVAAASAVCTAAMAADTVKVFRHKKLWSPCQYFSLNSTSITLLIIATKLPMDDGDDDEYRMLNLLAKFNGAVFLLTAIANFMSSLGSSKDKDILAHVVALAILVTTMAVNVLLQFAELHAEGYLMSYIPLLYAISLLLLLATVASLAVSAPAMKRSLESKYEEKREVAQASDQEAALGRTEKMMIYWVMAESSSPEFVMARSVVCTTSALLCLLSEATVLTISVLIWISGQSVSNPYGSVSAAIFFIQITGILVGSVAPMLRWLVVVSFKCSENYSKLPSPKELKRTVSDAGLLKKGLFEVESYWTQIMVDWRDSVPVWEIWDTSRKYYYLWIPKRAALTVCIGLQIFVVLLSKLFISISALFMTPFFLSYTSIKNFSKKCSCRSTTNEDDGDDEMDLYLKEYVLLLDGELKLPKGVLSDMCRRARNTIQTGTNNQPRHLIELLKEFIDYKGVEGTVDDVSEDIGFPNCWTLPVVTLACIAQALPSGNDGKRKQLMSSVSEGLSLARLVDDIQNAQLVNIRRAADKFLDFDFKRYTGFSSSKKVLEALSTEARSVVEKFNKGPSLENPLNWPTHVVAAKSMFGVTRALLSWLEKGEEEKLFEQTSAMIAFMLAASLTNLPEVITTMCQSSAIEKREKSVRKAFLLLGKTEQILQLVQKKRPISYDEAAPGEVKLWGSLFQPRANTAEARSIDL